MCRRRAFFSPQPLPHAAVNFENLITPLLVKRRAAHSFFHVVGSSVGICNDGHHHVIELGDEQIARGHVDFPLIDLGSRLIEALFHVAQIEYDEIGRGFAYDPNDLTFFHRESLSRVALDDGLADNRHAILQESVSKRHHYPNAPIKSKTKQLFQAILAK